MHYINRDACSLLTQQQITWTVASVNYFPPHFFPKHAVQSHSHDGYKIFLTPPPCNKYWELPLLLVSLLKGNSLQTYFLVIGFFSYLYNTSHKNTCKTVKESLRRGSTISRLLIPNNSIHSLIVTVNYYIKISIFNPSVVSCNKIFDNVRYMRLSRW
jgi:hypothetical protein